MVAINLVPILPLMILELVSITQMSPTYAYNVYA